MKEPIRKVTDRYIPLADRMRPVSFDEIAGQEHLFGENGVIRKMIRSGSLPSMIFFGPPGTGKTTAAGLIAAQSGLTLRHLNATEASLSDVRRVAEETGGLFGSGGILLYLDEIQYFNKKQQQSLLEYIEDGRITLIASTTENPYYYIYDALLSRCAVFEFRPVSPDALIARMREILPKALEALGAEDVRVEEGALRKMAAVASGDVRRALTLLEGCIRVATGGEDRIVTEETVSSFVPSVYAGRFDISDDVHYDLLSCLQKSIRGSDPDAAVFYLARLLEGGDLLSACRRLLVIASEDIGQAYPMAAAITYACVESAKALGLPEGRIPLANATVMLATAPKSNTANTAIERASADVQSGLGGEIPDHLRSPLFKGYVYPHDFTGDWVEQSYLPKDLIGKKYYEFGENKTEQASKAYWEKIRETGGKKKS
ncbi:MAG: replication-associated recombination protein A [Clostridia bacterium]|nr:replication-associated recombination protein A [Clostridia bacterium]